MVSLRRREEEDGRNTYACPIRYLPFTHHGGQEEFDLELFSGLCNFWKRKNGTLLDFWLLVLFPLFRLDI